MRDLQFWKFRMDETRRGGERAARLPPAPCVYGSGWKGPMGSGNRYGEHVGGSAESTGGIDAFYDIGIGGTGRDCTIDIRCLGIDRGIEDRIRRASFEGAEYLIPNDGNRGAGWCGPTEAHRIGCGDPSAGQRYGRCSACGGVAGNS